MEVPVGRHSTCEIGVKVCGTRMLRGSVRV